MTPVIYTGPPDPEHGGNFRPAGWFKLDIMAVRWLDGEPVHGAAVFVGRPVAHYSVLHSSDDLGPWLAAGWRLTSY